MGDPVGFYTINRRPSAPAPRDYGNTPYEEQFRVQPTVMDPYRRARTPDALANGPRSPLRSQDPPHYEPIWPSSASPTDPYETRYTYPDTNNLYPNRNQHPDNRSPYLDEPPLRDSSRPYPADTSSPYPGERTAYPARYPDDRYINPPDPRMQRARTPDALDEDRRYVNPPDRYQRARTPDMLDGDRRYQRARTPDALDDRGYPPRAPPPDQRARRAATPDYLDDRPVYPQNRYNRARTPDILDDRPKTLDNRYTRARTPDPLGDKPRYYTLDNRPPLSPRSRMARTPDELDGYPRNPEYSRNGDYKPVARPPSGFDPERLFRAPSYDPYNDLDPYSHSRSSDNLDDVWGKMMKGDEDYENYIPDLVMTACKRDQTLTVRVDRVTRDQVDVTQAHHIGDGPFKDIIINKPVRKLPEVDEPEIKMKFLVHMKDKRRYDGAKEVRELRYWFKPYINDNAQTDNAKDYFKTLLQPEAFPRDYVGFLKKALVLTRHFPMVERLEIAMYPAPPDADKRASFIDVQQEQVVVTPMQPLLGPANYGSGGHGGPGGTGGTGGLAFRDKYGPDLFAKIKQGDGREYYKDAAEEEDEEIDYDKIVENFITVHTPAVYDYQYLPEVPVSDKRHIVFQVKAKADAHIALSSVYGDTDRKTYEVVIGGWNNKKSCIRYGGQGDIVEEATTLKILSGDELRRFWISWDIGLVQVGEGRRKGADTFLRWKIPENRQFSINCLAVSTGPDSKGEWEFVELIKPPGPEDETKQARRARFRTSLLWLAKKQRMLQFLEDAYPNSMNTPDLLSLCKIKLHDMMTAVVMLRDLQTRGLITEVSKGIWMRSPGAAQDKNHVVKMVDNVPSLSGRDVPTVAIITGAYCEKLAADAMMDFKTSYVHYKQDGESQVYTIGRIGAHQVVSTKLSRVGSSKQATIAMGNTVTRLLGIFGHIEHILVVGVAGGVPHFTDFDKHVKLGDIVVGMPETSKGPVYIQCDRFETLGHDKYEYEPRYWAARNDTLYSYVRKLRDMSQGPNKPWDKYIEQGKDVLHAEESNFYRPAAKTDKLFALVDNEMVQVEHPKPPVGYDRHREENKPRIRYGPIGGGRYIARNFKIRMDFAMKNGVKAYDTEFAPVFESIEGNRKSSYLIVRGIADYVDGQKNKDWQPYAALAAAAYMKALLVALPNNGRRY